MSNSIVSPLWFSLTNKQPPLRRLYKFRNWLESLYIISEKKLGKMNYQTYSTSPESNVLGMLRWDYKYLDRECKANIKVKPFDTSPDCPTIEEFKLPWTPEQLDHVNYLVKVWALFNVDQTSFDRDAHMRVRKEMIVSINDDDVKMDRIFTDLSLSSPARFSY